jgi:hypothetical protein
VLYEKAVLLRIRSELKKIDLGEDGDKCIKNPS